MKTISQALLSTFTVVGLVSSVAAQPAPPAAPPAPPKTATPPKAITPPSDELVKYGAMAAGTWHCKGTVNEMDGSSHPMNGTNKVTVELDKFWVHDSFSAPQGKFTFRFEAYTTYDATAKLWKRAMVTNDGGWMQGTAKPDPAKMDWDMTMDGPNGQGMFRDHADMSDMKTGMKNWGEMSPDKGKTWVKVYEETCKK